MRIGGETAQFAVEERWIEGELCRFVHSAPESLGEGAGLCTFRAGSFPRLVQVFSAELLTAFHRFCARERGDRALLRPDPEPLQRVRNGDGARGSERKRLGANSRRAGARPSPSARLQR